MLELIWPTLSPCLSIRHILAMFGLSECSSIKFLNRLVNSPATYWAVWNLERMESLIIFKTLGARLCSVSMTPFILNERGSSRSRNSWKQYTDGDFALSTIWSMRGPLSSAILTPCSTTDRALSNLRITLRFSLCDSSRVGLLFGVQRVIAVITLMSNSEDSSSATGVVNRLIKSSSFSIIHVSSFTYAVITLSTDWDIPLFSTRGKIYLSRIFSNLPSSSLAPKSLGIPSWVILLKFWMNKAMISAFSLKVTSEGDSNPCIGGQ